MTTTRIVLPGKPKTFGRPVDVGDRRITPAEYRDWKDAAAGRINLTRRGVAYDGPVHVEVFVYPDGVVATFTGTTPNVRPPGITGDLDNYVKAILDAAQDGHLIGNDAQVQRISAYFINDEPFPA